MRRPTRSPMGCWSHRCYLVGNVVAAASVVDAVVAVAKIAVVESIVVAAVVE